MNNDDGHASTLVAEEISQPFTVFSAKKFPGMTGKKPTPPFSPFLFFFVFFSFSPLPPWPFARVLFLNRTKTFYFAFYLESTDLSKAFAKQGLKIPIRNDLRARKADRD